MKYCYVLVFVLLTVPVMASAQDTGSVIGHVADGSGGAVPGASVILPELDLGTVTDVEGRFELAGVPEGTHELRVSFVGYRTVTETVEVRAGQETAQNFTLREDLLQLEQIVVTGLGSGVERRQLTANVDVISAFDIEESPVMTVDQLLQGRVAGSSVRLQSAQPGQGAVMNLRGITSVFGSQTPVIYIDGVRVDNSSGTSYSMGGELTSALADILTMDIERIEVTKGGAASTLYGSDAASGVIQIFTRRGQEGAPAVSFRTEQGIDIPVTTFLRDTGFSYHYPEDHFNWSAAVNNPDSPNYGRTSFIRDNFLRTGHFQRHLLGVSGGSSTLTYNVSGQVQHSTGVQPSNENTMYALRGNVQAQAYENLNVSFSGGYTRNNFSRLNNGTAIADPLTAYEVGDAHFFSGANDFEEALRRFSLPSIKEGVNRFTLASTAEYNPSDLFTTSLTAGIDNRANEQRVFYPQEFDVISGNEDGSLDRFDRNYTVVTLEYRGTISYPRTGPITSDFTFGAQGFREETSIVTAFGETFALPGTEDIGEAATITANESRSQIFNGGFFFREQIGIYDKAFINAGLRLDGNSAFGTDVGLQTYPSLGIAYNISDEGFWYETFGDIWNEMRFRLAYGATGKFPGAFDRDITFGATSFRGESAPRFDNPGNLDLRPEKTATIEAGFEASLLDGRIGLNFNYYQSTTTDALFFVPEQPATGRGTQLRNVGEISNHGVELSVDTRLISTRNVVWTLGADYSWFENEVKDMGILEDFNVGGDVGYNFNQRVSVGHPIGVWRAMTPVDGNGDGNLDSSEMLFQDTTPYPTQTGSFRTSLSLFQNLTIRALADWALGAEVWDWGSVWSSFNGLERTVTPIIHDQDGNPILDSAGEPVRFSVTNAASELLKNGDYLKIREIGLTYGLPAALTDPVGIRSGNITLSMRNLFTFARQDYVDPELVGVATPGQLELGGIQSVTLSPPRQIRLGLQINL